HLRQGRAERAGGGGAAFAADLADHGGRDEGLKAVIGDWLFVIRRSGTAAALTGAPTPSRHSSESWNPSSLFVSRNGDARATWIPAFAGMTGSGGVGPFRVGAIVAFGRAVQQVPDLPEQFPERPRRPVAVAFLDCIARQLPQLLPVGLREFAQQLRQRAV